MRNAARDPSTPITFQRELRRNSLATAPAASGGLRRDRRPKASSAHSSGVAINTQASTNTRMNALPPFVPVRYGKRQILPRPTAAPAVPRYTAKRDDQTTDVGLVLMEIFLEPSDHTCKRPPMVATRRASGL